MKLWNRLNDFVARAAVATKSMKKEDGQTMVEYGLIIALIALGVVLALTTLGGDISKEFGNIASQL